MLSSVSGTNSWARYYDLSVCNPAASSVYGLIFGSTTSVSSERLTGYAQYNSTAQAMLKNFATWSSKNARP